MQLGSENRKKIQTPNQEYVVESELNRGSLLHDPQNGDRRARSEFGH